MTSKFLPESWELAVLEKISNFIDYRGKTPKKTVSGIPLITAKNIRNGFIKNEPQEFISEDDYDSWMTRGIPKFGDILITTEAPLGNVALLHVRQKIALAQRTICIQPFSAHMNSYIHYALRSPEFQKELTSNSTGTTVSGIKASTLKKLGLPLPSLSEQKIIAEKLDTLMVQVDSIKAHLEKTLKILKRFRQAVLCAAVNGKLTEKWRDEKKIPFKSWEIKKANDLCIKVQSGSTPTGNPFAQNGTIPFLKVYNIVNQKIDFDYKPQYITDEVHRARSKRSIAIPDDVLMNIVGPPLGKVAILTEQYPEWNINQAITLFRVDKDKLLSGFLYHVLCEGGLVRDVMHETKGIVGQINISLTQCREALIPCPSLEEQHEIVRRVEQLVAYADTIEKQVNNALARVNNLTQSILAKAFRGELTAQWRAENPELISGENSAAALLEKIKAERAASTGKKATRKKS